MQLHGLVCATAAGGASRIAPHSVHDPLLLPHRLQVGITAGVEWTVVRYLVDLINMFRGPEEEPFAFNKIQFWLVYSGEAGRQTAVLYTD